MGFGILPRGLPSYKQDLLISSPAIDDRQCGVVEGAYRPYPGEEMRTDARNYDPEDLRLIQDLLNIQRGYQIEIDCLEEDGVFGPATRNAVEAMQQFLGLAVTGVVDADFWSLMMLYFE